MIDSTPHLLFVDDETELRTLMAERLRERGFEVVEAENGEQALDLLDQFAFDILIALWKPRSGAIRASSPS